ncbi:hypothetical protein SDC9_45663 [bioreactor metagenome]|uniref:Outer membrane protein beta-barrel domain-containing protein n=1 Tax=bioreactor metagenome TaxID=1076179 RepID=A0A644W6P5_9ZZZZ
MCLTVSGPLENLKNSFIKLFLCSLVLLISVSASAQHLTVSVRDRAKNPLFGSTVKLTENNDTNKTLFASTDINGNAVFPDVRDGMYILLITNIGFEPLRKTIAVNAQHREYSYILQQSSVSLGEVTITADRPFIRQEDDKMIVDPAPMIGISTNTLEVIEATPGIYVDYDAGIFLSSTTPAQIYINGREQKLSNQDMMNLLRNLPPGSIERIEILRTPSTKYDAASSGGIVNVVLKKGLKIGRFGNLNVGMNQGKYGNRNAGGSFNNSTEKSTYYINANYSRHDRIDDMNTLREMSADTILDQSSGTRQTSDEVYVGFGVNRETGKKSTLSYDGRLSYSNRNTEVLSDNIISGESGQTLLENNDSVKKKSSDISLSQEIGFNLKLDTLDSEWDTKLSLDFIKSRTDQEYITLLSYPADTFTQGGNTGDQKRLFLQFQSDLTKRFKNEIKLEAGIKGSWQIYNSDADYFRFQNTIHIADSTRINSYKYNEGIFAAYSQASRTIWGNIVIKAGCRLEYTYMDGQQVRPTDTSFMINRADLFPYLYLSRDLPTLLPNIVPIKLRTYLIYRRTISRPGYDELNPAINYIDPFLYQSGNPELKPQFTQNAEFNISYEDMPVLALGVNYTNDIFSEVTYSDNQNSNMAIMTFDNLGRNTETYLRGLIGIPPGGKYFFAIGAQYNMNKYDGFYDGEPLVFERGSWRFFTFHSLRLTKNTKLTVNGFMLVNGQRGFYELGNFGSLNCGLTQTCLNQKLLITISARDILGTMVTRFELNQGSVSASGDRYRDSRRIGINIRYNFGLDRKESRKQFFNPGDNGPAD